MTSLKISGITALKVFSGGSRKYVRPADSDQGQKKEKDRATADSVFFESITEDFFML